MIESIKTIKKRILKNKKIFLMPLFILLAFLVFNFSGIYDNQPEEESVSIAEQKPDSALEAVGNAVEDLGENIDDITILTEVQAEESMEKQEDLSEEETIDEGTLPENKSSIIVKSKWAWPLVSLPQPKIKKKSDELKIGFITDTHVTSTQYAGGIIRMEDIYRERMEYFIKQMNNTFTPNLILINGDVIEGTKRPIEVGMEELSQCRDIFNQTSIKKYWTVGNHDLRSVNKSQWKQALGIDYTSKSFEVNDYKIIIADGNFYYKDGSDISPGKNFTPGIFSTAQKEWLKKELENSNKKKIIFVHQPLLSSGKNMLRKASEIRAMFSGKNVIAVFSGHTEGLFHGNLDGVQYFTIPGMTKNSSYPANFAEITIKDTTVSTKIFFKPNGGNLYKSKSIK